MRCGYNRIMEIVRTVYGRDPYDGDVYFYMSKNQRTVRMVNFEHHQYCVHTNTFDKGYRFMCIVTDIPTLISCEGMTDSEKNDFINFINDQLKEREAQNEALHAKLDAQMERFDKLQATLDAISRLLAESNKMKEVLQKGFDNMHTQLEQMKDELVKTQKELRKFQREAKKYRELYEVLRDEKFVTKSQKSKQNKEKGRDDDKAADNERSNSKSFGSNEGVESSAIYHTIIATCKAQTISVCDYLKKFFTACVNGRTDYENLTPMMLCQPVK